MQFNRESNQQLSNIINSIKMKKEIYSRPMAEFLDLEVEGNVLQTQSPGGYIPGGGGSYGDNDTNENGDI